MSFPGLGIANFYVSLLVSIYYNILLAWTIYYPCASFTANLPWGFCGEDYNSDCKLKL